MGLGIGTISRIVLLKNDYRNYPGYPHGYVTHISLGFIAAALGAVAVPALVEKEYTAVTFLALAAQQFREIRNMERESLKKIENISLVPRGEGYIEGIARVFESRNYLVMATALGTSIATYLAGWIYGLIAGSIIIAISYSFFMKGKVVGDIAEVVPVKPYFKNTLLMVEDIVIMNVGLPESREKIEKEGIAVLIKPKDDNARATLHDPSQRQAIIHTGATLLGTKAEIGEQEWTPLARKNIDTGEIGFFLLANEPDKMALVEAVNRTPVLESAKRNILSTKVSRYAAD
ncbi:MAG: uncharacterized protein PWQ96_278 [Clostridia bacterium]|nr:uncharacterized protein [Clostridia bacterium]